MGCLDEALESMFTGDSSATRPLSTPLDAGAPADRLNRMVPNIRLLAASFFGSLVAAGCVGGDGNAGGGGTACVGALCATGEGGGSTSSANGGTSSANDDTGPADNDGTRGTSSSGAGSTSAGGRGTSSSGAGSTSSGGQGGASEESGGSTVSCVDADTCSDDASQVCDPVTQTCDAIQCPSGNCPIGEICRDQLSGETLVGACYVECESIPNGCGPGQTCVLVGGNPFTVTHCLHQGTAMPGEACQPGATSTGCVEGYRCFGEECVELCDFWAGSGTCSEPDERCFAGATCHDTPVNGAPIGGSCEPFSGVTYCGLVGDRVTGFCGVDDGICYEICRPGFNDCGGGTCAQLEGTNVNGCQ